MSLNCCLYLYFKLCCKNSAAFVAKIKNRAENKICIVKFHISQNSNSLTTETKLNMKGTVLTSGNTRDKRDVTSLLKIISLLA